MPQLQLINSCSQQLNFQHYFKYLRRRQNMLHVSIVCFWTVIDFFEGGPIFLQGFVYVQSQVQPVPTKLVLGCFDPGSYRKTWYWFILYYHVFWHFWNTISPKTLRNQVERLCFFRVCGGHIAKMLEGRPGEVVEDATIPPRKLKNKKTAYSTSSYINLVP